jgi:hypothetical protein
LVWLNSPSHASDWICKHPNEWEESSLLIENNLRVSSIFIFEENSFSAQNLNVFNVVINLINKNPNARSINFHLYVEGKDGMILSALEASPVLDIISGNSQSSIEADIYTYKKIIPSANKLCILPVYE